MTLLVVSLLPTKGNYSKALLKNSFLIRIEENYSLRMVNLEKPFGIIMSLSSLHSTHSG
jgi:hypothetical protein